MLGFKSFDSASITLNGIEMVHAIRKRQLTTQDVLNAISEQNVQVAAGRIGEEPAPVGTAFQLVINTQGRLTTDDEFADIIVKTADGGRARRRRRPGSRLAGYSSV